MRVLKQYILVVLSVLFLVQATAFPVQAANENVTVYVTKTGKCYHADGCSSLKKSKIAMNLSQAAGKYKPCDNCNPVTLNGEAQTSAAQAAVQNVGTRSAVSTSAVGALATTHTVYVTVTGKKYHEASCRYVKSNSTALDVNAAIAQGYGACSVCH